MDGSTPDVKAEVAPALGISMNVQVDGNRQLVFQGYVGRDDPVSVLNGVLDKIGAAADRQVAKYMLIGLRKELAQQEKALKDQREDMVRVESAKRAAWDNGPKRGAYKSDAKDQTQRDNLLINEQKFEQAIADIKAKITETEAKAR